jgi:hypothetical protein
MNTRLETLIKEITTVKRKLVDINERLVKARALREYDSFAGLKAETPLRHERDINERRLRDLDYEIRRQSPPGAGNVGSIFFGSDR